MDRSEFDTLYQKAKEKFEEMVRRGEVDPRMSSSDGYIFQMYCEELAEHFTDKKTAARGKSCAEDDRGSAGDLRFPKHFYL